jgi:uncharacterized cupin superfamily protein
MPVNEAKIEETDVGAVVASEGWFVLNLADGAWTHNERGGEWLNPEPEGSPFEQYGIGPHVLQPGQANGLYHSENMQEDFLVLAGECIVVIEEEERHLKTWDLVHCPPGTRHIFVGTGDGPCAILMVGARGEGKELHYPPSEVAARHGASVDEGTDSPKEAYRDFPREFTQVRPTWPL